MGPANLRPRCFLNPKEMENRHNQAFDTYELGKLTPEEYLNQVVFYKKRFTRAQFQAIHVRPVTPYPEMIELVAGLRHGMD